MTDGPYETPRQARAAAHAIIPPVHGWSILRKNQNRELLRRALHDAAVDLTPYEATVVDWLGQWEDATCQVVAAWITRAAARAREGES